MNPRKLPDELLDLVLRRLVATYGRRFWLQYEGAEPADVRAVWSRELGTYTDHAERVFGWAFERLPEDPPNAIAFRNLCRACPPPPAPQLEEPKADPERVRAELAKVRELLQRRPTTDTDRLAWARRAVERAEAGERVAHVTLQRAREALARVNVANTTEADA